MRHRLVRGFTLVEVSVVIALIGILASITVVSFSQAQRQARDKTREASAQMIASSLEKYYVNNGEYPGCSKVALDATTVTSQYLTGIDKAVLRTPSNTSLDDNSIVCGDATINTSDIYAYVGETSTTCATGSSCLEFTLKWRQEADNQIKSISSEHKALIATSGAISVNASPTGTTTGTASWTNVPNAISYTLQISGNAAFTAPTTSSYTGTTANFTGLTQGTTYWVRVRALSANSTGDWSNTDTLTTTTIVAPTITATAQSATQIGVSWGTVAGASGYTMQYSSDNATWTTLVNNLATTSYTHSGLGQGTRNYYRVQAIVGGTSGNWGVANAVTPITAPPAWNLYSNDYGEWNNFYLGADQATCPAGTTPSYDWHYHSNIRGDQFWVSGPQYKSVGFSLFWNENVWFDGYARCYTSETSSGFTLASNHPSKYLYGPSISQITGAANSTLPTWRRLHWFSGQCPAYTTSWGVNYLIDNYTFRVSGGGITTTDASGYADGWYSNQGVVWGNGASRADLICNGPWGQVSTWAHGSYGTGCVPVEIDPKCAGPWW